MIIASDGLELIAIKDEIKEIVAGGSDSRDRDIELMHLVNGYRRRWQIRASIDGMAVGMALGLLVALAYSFF
jgi:hypothetical protein